MMFLDAKYVTYLNPELSMVPRITTAIQSDPAGENSKSSRLTGEKKIGEPLENVLSVYLSMVVTSFYSRREK